MCTYDNVYLQFPYNFNNILFSVMVTLACKETMSIPLPVVDNVAIKYSFSSAVGSERVLRITVCEKTPGLKTTDISVNSV